MKYDFLHAFLISALSWDWLYLAVLCDHHNILLLRALLWITAYTGYGLLHSQAQNVQLHSKNHALYIDVSIHL